ncbi:lysine-rich arabinogalactan protein 19-like [Nilaparvata lugens]|uniref:lysine-rich arabinogalactan protein 19-like n=1 Tax=Nilaparvata lugens TaxID=108931 RepID=UPI00193D4A51|nr:lysine-rich arabinogalactan protein 19-like [Nilaparvata lugens]
MSSFVNAPTSATATRPTTAVGNSTQARTYAVVCGGGLTAPTYSQPAVMAAASWNPYSMWGPPPPWYTSAYPGLGQQQAPLQAPPPPSAELLAAATTPIGAAETTPAETSPAIPATPAETSPAISAIPAAPAETIPIVAAEADSSDDVKIVEESGDDFIEATPPTRELVKRSPSWTKVEKKKKKKIGTV